MKNFSNYRAYKQMLTPPLKFNCNSPPFLNKIKRRANDITVDLADMS